MRHRFAALALATAIVAPGLALAQQGNTANPGSANTPPMTMAPATQAPGTTAAPGTTTGPGTSTAPAPANREGGGMATRPAQRNESGAPAAADRTDNAPPVTTTPAAGANSFTEGQARSRIEAAGFTGIQDLRKDDAGVWRGRAMRAGQTTDVGLDFQGNVVTGAAPAR